ncbi:hypothetical membrane spanning protein [Mycoplasmopsis fermentans JER]|nr:hypothetical membrane spanning protein [Mycoplasmopsis fermentans JER]
MIRYIFGFIKVISPAKKLVGSLFSLNKFLLFLKFVAYAFLAFLSHSDAKTRWPPKLFIAIWNPPIPSNMLINLKFNCSFLLIVINNLTLFLFYK